MNNMNLNKIVKKIVQNALENSKNNMTGSFIGQIHPDVNVKYNSVNVIVGKQRQGKTVIALQEI